MSDKKTPFELFDLSDRVAVVTGGVGLLGAEFCRTLAGAGAQVVIADIDLESVNRLTMDINALGFHASGRELDVTVPSSVQQTMDSVSEEFGRLDILVNSAALNPKVEPNIGLQDQQWAGFGAFEDYPLETWRQALDVNLTGAFLSCQAAAKVMLDDGGGTIINISSIYGLSGPDQRLYQEFGKPSQYKPVYYSVTKWGILGLTQYLATYFAGKNIRVNALSPGGVYSNQDDRFVQAYSARAVLGRMAEVDEMNGAILFLASDASAYMTGANLIVDGGWTAW